MCEKILCQISLRGSVVFPPVFLLQGGPSPRGPVGFPCLHRQPVYTDPKAVCSDRPLALICVVRAPSTPGAHRGPLARPRHRVAQPPMLLVRSLLDASATSLAGGLPPHLACPPPPTSRLFRSVKREESVFPVLVVWILASFCRGFPTCQERRTLLWVVTEVLSIAGTTLPTLPLSSSVLLLCQLGLCSTARN